MQRSILKFIFVIIGTAFLVMSYFYIKDNLLFLKYSVTASAEVRASFESNQFLKKRIQIKYKNQDGDILGFSDESFVFFSPKKGQTVTVKYLPLTPNTVMVYQPIVFWGKAIVTVVLGVSSLFFAFFYNRATKKRMLS